jgi:hypothetical protein
MAGPPGYLQQSILDYLEARHAPVSCGQLAEALRGSRDPEMVRRVRVAVTRLQRRGLVESWVASGRLDWTIPAAGWERRRVVRRGRVIRQATPRVRWVTRPGERPVVPGADLGLMTLDDLAALVGADGTAPQ